MEKGANKKGERSCDLVRNQGAYKSVSRWLVRRCTPKDKNLGYVNANEGVLSRSPSRISFPFASKPVFFLL